MIDMLKHKLHDSVAYAPMCTRLKWISIELIAVWEYRNGFLHISKACAPCGSDWHCDARHSTEIFNHFLVRYCASIGLNLKSHIAHTSKSAASVHVKSTRKMLYLCSTDTNWFTSNHLKAPPNVRTHPKPTRMKVTAHWCVRFVYHTHTHAHVHTCRLFGFISFIFMAPPFEHKTASERLFNSERWSGVVCLCVRASWIAPHGFMFRANMPQSKSASFIKDCAHPLTHTQFDAIRAWRASHV